MWGAPADDMPDRLAAARADIRVTGHVRRRLARARRVGAGVQRRPVVLPISALVATLVTVGMLTKSSELTVMKACGISLYRVSLPLLLFSLVWSGVLFGMSESVLADANRRAESVRHVIRGGSPQTFDLLNRKWIVSPDGAIYHYVHFDPNRVELNGLTTYRFSDDDWRLRTDRCGVVCCSA